MKTVAFVNNYGETVGEMASLSISDSCLSPCRRPLFIPDFDSDIRMFPALGIKISRLGKHIAPRFAHRYFTSGCIVMTACANRVLDNLKEKGLPWGSAFCFDNSVLYSPEFPLEAENVAAFKLSVRLNGNPTSVWNGSDMHLDIREIIALASRENTLKTGDLIIPALPDHPFKVKENDIVEVFTDDSHKPYATYKIK